LGSLRFLAFFYSLRFLGFKVGLRTVARGRLDTTIRPRSARRWSARHIHFNDER